MMPHCKKSKEKVHTMMPTCNPNPNLNPTFQHTAYSLYKTVFKSCVPWDELLLFEFKFHVENGQMRQFVNKPLKSVTDKY